MESTPTLQDPLLLSPFPLPSTSGFLAEIDGCLSTGKEANVYYATAGPKCSGDAGCTEFAVKIFKTSILVFKDRDKSDCL